MSRVEVRFDGDSRGALRAAAQTAAGIRGVGKAARDEDAHVNRLGASIRSSLGGLAVVAAKAGAAGILGLAGAVAFTGIRFDDLRQKSEIAFTTMLGSSTKAKSMLDDLAKFASHTPFEFPDLIRASQRLMAMGFTAKEIIPTMTAVGDAVAGFGGGAEEIDRVTRALGQMQAKGKATSEELMQLNEAGINGLKMIADKMGVTTVEAQKRITAGAVSARFAISALTEGMERDFGGMMEKQSHTFSGALSNLKDNFGKVSGTVMLPFFKMATDGMLRLGEITSSDSFTAGVERFATALEKRARVAAAAVVEFFHDHWGDIAAILRGTWDAVRVGFDVLKQVASFADKAAEAMGGWETAAKFILTGVLALKVINLANAFGGPDGLAGGLFRASRGITGPGGLLAALSSIPAMIAVAVVVTELVPRAIKVQGQTLLEQKGAGFLGKIPVVGPVAQAGAALGQDFGRAIGLKYKDAGGYMDGTPEHAAFEAGMAGKAPPIGALTNAPVLDAYLAGRKRGSPIKTITPPVATASGGRTIVAPKVEDYSRDTTTDTPGGGGSGGSAKDAAAEAREAAADRQMEAWQQAIELRNAKQAEVASILTAVGGYEAGLRADRLAAAKERAKDFADGLAKVTAANTARMADLVEKSMDAAKQALEQGRGAFAASFGRVGEAGLRAFDAATSRMQGDLARNLKTALDEIEKSRKALTAEEQAYADFRGRAQDRSLTAEEQAYADFKSGRAAAARAATRAEVMAMEDGAAKTARLRELDLDDQERALADSAATSRAARDAALADQERALAASADASRVARDVEAATKAASVQAEYDTAKLQLDANRALERDHYAGQLDDLATYLSTRKLSVDDANKAIAKLFKEFGVDPSFKQAGIDAGDGFATGLRERLADALKSFEKLQQIAAPGVPKTAGEAMRIVFPNFHAFAGGGRVPGRYVGVADTVQARLTPGETVIDRRLTKALESVFLGGSGGRLTVRGDVYIDGEKAGRLLEPRITTAQGRYVGYAVGRG